MKRIIFLLAVLMALTVAVPVLAEVPADVPAEHWAVQAIDNLYDRGIFVGYPDASFRGDRAVTRYELAVVLYRLLESLPEGADLNNFVTKQELTTRLANYPTKTELQTTLQAYPTKTELQTALGNYVTKAEFQQRLATLATKEDMAKLQAVVDNLRNELTAMGVKVDDILKRLAALEGRMSSLEERVAALEGRPAPIDRFIFSMKGGLTARNEAITDWNGYGDGVTNENDYYLNEGFWAAAAMDMQIGMRLNGGLDAGVRVYSKNEDMTEANLENFDTELGFFVAKGNTRLDIGVFDAFFTPFTMARSERDITELLPAFGLDKYMSGAKLTTKLGAFDTTLLYSRPYNYEEGPFRDNRTVFGGRVTFSPASMLDLGFNYVLANGDGTTDLGTTVWDNRVWSIEAGIDVTPAIRLSGEYADSHTVRSRYSSTREYDGVAYKVQADVGAFNPYYLQIGSWDDRFYSFYGAPAAATQAFLRGPGMGFLMDRATLGQVPNDPEAFFDEFSDMNNNIRGYGAIVSLGLPKADLHNPVSPVLTAGADDSSLRVMLGYEALKLVDDRQLDETGLNTMQAKAAWDVFPNWTLLAGYVDRSFNLDPDYFGTFAESIFDFGVAWKFGGENYLALQHAMVDYEEDLNPGRNFSAGITKATVNLAF